MLKERIAHVVRHPLVFLLMLAGVIGFSMWLVLSTETRRTSPKNYIILGCFTFCEGMLFAGLTSRMDIQAVLMAASALAVLTTSLYVMVLYLKDFEFFHRAVAKTIGFAIFA